MQLRILFCILALLHCSGVSAKASQRQLWGSACRETLYTALNPLWRLHLHSTVDLPVLRGQMNPTPRYSHFQEQKLTLKAEEKFQSLEQQFNFPPHSCSLSEQNSGSFHNLFVLPCCTRFSLHLLEHCSQCCSLFGRVSTKLHPSDCQMFICTILSLKRVSCCILWLASSSLL